MINYNDLISSLADSPLQHWRADLSQQLHQLITAHNNGNLPRFLAHLNTLPDVQTEHNILTEDSIGVGNAHEL